MESLIKRKEILWRYVDENEVMYLCEKHAN
jgi:hypothetical protein